MSLECVVEAEPGSYCDHYYTGTVVVALGSKGSDYKSIHTHRYIYKLLFVE